MNDVPDQYKPLTDKLTKALASSGDAVWAVVGELGCDRFECEGELVTVTVVAKGRSESPKLPKKKDVETFVFNKTNNGVSSASECLAGAQYAYDFIKEWQEEN